MVRFLAVMSGFVTVCYFPAVTNARDAIKSEDAAAAVGKAAVNIDAGAGTDEAAAEATAAGKLPWPFLSVLDKTS
jgi:hypothetical protein